MTVLIGKCVILLIYRWHPLLWYATLYNLLHGLSGELQTQCYQNRMGNYNIMPWKSKPLSQKDWASISSSHDTNFVRCLSLSENAYSCWHTDGNPLWQYMTSVTLLHGVSRQLHKHCDQNKMRRIIAHEKSNHYHKKLGPQCLSFNPSFIGWLLLSENAKSCWYNDGTPFLQ